MGDTCCWDYADCDCGPLHGDCHDCYCMKEDCPDCGEVVATLKRFGVYEDRRHG